MSKQYRSKEALGNNNNQVIGERVFPEGSAVVLNAHYFIKDIDIHSIKSYSWKQKSDDNLRVENLTNENTQNLSFTAPYIEGSEVGTTLNFELTTTYIDGKITTHNASVVIKKVQRAIIFQGGVSLGALRSWSVPGFGW